MRKLTFTFGAELEGIALDKARAPCPIQESLTYPLQTHHGTVSQELGPYQFELATGICRTARDIAASLQILNTVVRKLLPKGGTVHYAPWNPHARVSVEDVLTSPYTTARVRATIEALKQESLDTYHHVAELTHACALQFHIGMQDAQGNTVPILEWGSTGINVFNILNNIATYMAYRTRIEYGIQPSNRLTVWATFPAYRRQPRFLPWISSVDEIASLIASTGPRLIRETREGEWEVDLRTPSSTHDPVTFKHLWLCFARPTAYATLEVRSLPALPLWHIESIAKQICGIVHGVHGMACSRVLTPEEAAALVYAPLHRTCWLMPKTVVSEQEWYEYLGLS